MRQTPGAALPQLWLISDARNDAGLEDALRALPRGSGFIYRHYHLPPPARRARFDALARLARRYGHMVVLAAEPRLARRWRADASYGPAMQAAFPHLATAHSLAELARASRTGAAAILLSPVFPTRSHPGAAALGPVRFRMLAGRVPAPVIALGGMNGHRARAMRWHHWAAIDSLSAQNS